MTIQHFPSPELPAPLTDAPASRRSILLLGLGLLATGCAHQTTARTLPGPAWPAHDELAAKPAPKPAAPSSPASASGVISRNQWATDKPVPMLMNRMLPVNFVTVHHDGMRPFYATDGGTTAARIDQIRRAHRDRGWGDIGYHFVIDRAGRVWEGRQLNWQGAHVKDRNEGNIGICCLGNFDEQTPSSQQLAALKRHLAMLMKSYRVPVKRIYTHQEWPGAQTACPGRSLEAFMKSVRAGGQLA
jgi:hypothetical protein